MSADLQHFEPPYPDGGRGALFAVIPANATVVVDVFRARTITDAESLATLMYGDRAMVLHARAAGNERVLDGFARVERANLAEAAACRAWRAE